MIRLLFFLTFSITIILSASTTVKDIKKTSEKLDLSSKSYKSVNQKLSKTAKAILKQKLVIKKQNIILKNIQKKLLEKEVNYQNNIKELKILKKYNSNLKLKQNSIEGDLVFMIAKSVSLSVILEEKNAVDTDSLIEFEVLKHMLLESKNKANKLNNRFYLNAKNIDKLNMRTANLEVAISNIDKKRKTVIYIQKKNKKLLIKLNKDKNAYKKELKNLIKKQDALKKTLAKLNIIKIDNEKKAREEKARRKAFAEKTTISSKNLPTVKKHGSSYKVVKTKKYKGKKTIAPLSSYKITKKYGTYTDPIYGIKIFNESISLKPNESNAKVKTVFNGKVIYADKTAVLNNIVIIEHKNGLHTIYANLSQISPNIRKGKKIKKGYAIGRVTDELIFEVTQKSYHINPIRLFK